MSFKVFHVFSHPTDMTFHYHILLCSFAVFVDMNWIPAPSGPLFSTKNNRCLSGLRLTPTRPQPGRTIKTNAWRAIQLRESG